MAKRWLRYLVVGFIGFFVILFLGTFAHYQTYARSNYDIPECRETYLFADYTFARQSKLVAAPLVDPKLARVATLLHVYSKDALLKEVGLLESLYYYATADDKHFFGDRATAIVIIKTIPGKDGSEEPLYCVVSKENIPLETLREDPQLNLAIRNDGAYPIPIESSRVIISWGPFWL